MAVFYPRRVLSDYNSGKYAPGYYWHAIDAGVPLSGQPNRFAYFDPRLGLSYDLRGNGKTMIRGGWGAYRFVTQVNDVSAPLVTAQHVLGYNLPGQKTVMLSQLNQLAYKPCTSSAGAESQTGFDPGDYGQPLTYAYNFTIDQRLKWNSVLDIAYVGSQTSQLSDNSEGIEGSNYCCTRRSEQNPDRGLLQTRSRSPVCYPPTRKTWERILTDTGGHSNRKQSGRLSPLWLRVRHRFRLYESKHLLHQLQRVCRWHGSRQPASSATT